VALRNGPLRQNVETTTLASHLANVLRLKVRGNAAFALRLRCRDKQPEHCASSLAREPAGSDFTANYSTAPAKYRRYYTASPIVGLTRRLDFYNIRPIKMGTTRQRELQFRTWGGRRRDSGRKPKGRRAGVPHRRRPIHQCRHPVHVTLRVLRGLPSLRSGRLFGAIRRGLSAANSSRVRIVHFSVQSNHVHLLVESESTTSLARGMQGLGIRLARTINGCLGRTGRVWADRYYGRPLRTSREVRHALVYVLFNARKHGAIGHGIDPCSSGAWFRGWDRCVAPPHEAAPIAEARTWLLRVGWRRSGRIRLTDAPKLEGG
jgi:REP element-mobilizing transposase RayT